MGKHELVLDFSRRKLFLSDKLLHFQKNPATSGVTFHLLKSDSLVNPASLLVRETRKTECEPLKNGRCCFSDNAELDLEPAHIPNLQNSLTFNKYMDFPPKHTKSKENVVVDCTLSRVTYKFEVNFLLH